MHKKLFFNYTKYKLLKIIIMRNYAFVFTFLLIIIHNFKIVTHFKYYFYAKKFKRLMIII